MKFLSLVLIMLFVACEEATVTPADSESLSSSYATIVLDPPPKESGSRANGGNGPSYLLSSLASPTVNLVITPGMEVVIDRSSEFNSITIQAGGVLRCDEILADPEITIMTKFIMVHGEFLCGSENNSYEKKLNIVLKHNPNLDPRLYIPDQSGENHAGVKYRAIHVMGGKLKLFGSQKKSGWGYLAGTLNENANILTVMKPTNGAPSAADWEYDDTIVVGPTGFDPAEAETFKVLSVDPNKYANRIEVLLQTTSDHRHEGTIDSVATQSMGQVTLNERAEVANLTRNIRILPFEAVPGQIDNMDAPYDQVGAHVMIMDRYDTQGNKISDGEAYIDSVEFYRMGQAGIMARYPFHWHKSGNVDGQFIKNSSIHASFQRCITVHQTDFAEVRNNVCYDYKGHGYFLEDGNEIKNKLIRNLAIRSKFPDADKLLLSSDDPRKNANGSFVGGNQFGRFHPVAAFWISNPDNEITWNVASGSVGTGFWNAFKDKFQGQDGEWVYPNETPTLKFWYNTAHASIIGMTWDGAEKFNAGPSPDPNTVPEGQKIINRNPDSKILSNSHYAPANGQVPVFKGLRVFKNRLTGIYFRSNTNILENLIAADNGWSLWNAYNNIVRDSVIIGKTYNSSSEIYAGLSTLDNRRRFFRAGVIVYDGPFEVHNTDFLNFEVDEYSEDPAYYYDIPIMSIGGNRKFVNVMSGLHFDPQPFHKAYLFDENTTYNSPTPTEPHILGESMIRDLDGSLIGNANGSYITGKNSLGITANQGCVNGGESFHNYKVCPQSVIEHAAINLKIGNAGHGQEGFNPYVVRRMSDGKLNLEKQFWAAAIAGDMKNIKFSMTNDPDEIYELVTEHEYRHNKAPGGDESVGHHMEATLGSELNGDDPNFSAGVIKYVGYGNNCYLENATAKTNLFFLRQSTETAYFRDGTDLYVKLVPNHKFTNMNISSEQQAKTFLTYILNAEQNPIKDRHRIFCDDSFVTSFVRGRIDNVTYGETHTTISGWACNLRRANRAKVRVELYKPKAATVYVTEPEFVTIAAEPAINFKCASMGLTTARFNIAIPKEDLSGYPDYMIKVLGVSTTQGGQNRYLNRSGEFPAVSPFTK